MPSFLPSIIGVFWRTIVSDLSGNVLTCLDNAAGERTVTPVLNTPMVATGSVASDDRRVNLVAGDGDPYLAEGTRLMWMFRRDYANPHGTPWTPRFAGVINQVDDQAASDDARTHYTAEDPWRYLYSVPVLRADGSLLRAGGLSYHATTGDVIVGQLLQNALLNVGPLFLDPGAFYGGTGFWAGTFETTAAIDINFQQGISVGEALKQLCDTGTLDVVLSPVYDPINRPGILCDVSVFVQAGVDNTMAIFAWDRPGRSLVGLDRLFDGTQRANVIQFFYGQGGPPVTQESDAGSIATYQAYWAQQFWPGQKIPAAVDALAQAQLALRKNGKQTVTVNPTPTAGRSPAPFVQYGLGDRVRVYASAAGFRADLAGEVRLYGFPIQISDDALETVTSALTSPSGFTP